MAVLRGKPLTHVDAKPKFVYRTFPFFFLHVNSQRGCIKGKKVRLFKGRHTQSTIEASIARKRSKSLTSPASATLGLFLHYELFFMRRDGLSILKACSYIFYLKWVFGSHVTWNSAVPDPNVWCCILLFLCTLDVMERNRSEITVFECSCPFNWGWNVLIASSVWPWSGYENGPGIFCC